MYCPFNRQRKGQICAVTFAVCNPKLSTGAKFSGSGLANSNTKNVKIHINVKVSPIFAVYFIIIFGALLKSYRHHLCLIFINKSVGNSLGQFCT